MYVNIDIKNKFIWIKGIVPHSEVKKAFFKATKKKAIPDDWKWVCLANEASQGLQVAASFSPPDEREVMGFKRSNQSVS